MRVLDNSPPTADAPLALAFFDGLQDPECARLILRERWRLETLVLVCKNAHDVPCLGNPFPALSRLIVRPDPPDRLHSGGLLRALLELMEYAQSLRQLVLVNIPAGAFPPSKYPQPPVPMEALEEIVLSSTRAAQARFCDGRGSLSSAAAILPHLGELPRLRHLRMDHFDLGADGFARFVRVSRPPLTKLTVAEGPFAEMLGAFHMLPGLRVLEMTRARLDESTKTDDLIVLNNLAANPRLLPGLRVVLLKIYRWRKRQPVLSPLAVSQMYALLKQRRALCIKVTLRSPKEEQCLSAYELARKSGDRLKIVQEYYDPRYDSDSGY